MGGDPFKHVHRGEPLQIPAQWFNTVSDLARRNRGQQVNGSPLPMAGPPAIVVPIRNDSGSAVGRFGILAITGAILSPTANLAAFQNQPALVGTTPDLPANAGRFVVLQEPVADGRIGRGLLQGITAVQVEVPAGEAWTADAPGGGSGTTDYTWYQWADIETDSGHETARLKATPHGAAQILWRELGTGTKWALVRVGMPAGQRQYWGVLKDNLYSGSGDTPATIYLGSSSPEILVAEPPILTTGIDIDTDIEISWWPHEQKFYVTGAAC